MSDSSTIRRTSLADSGLPHACETSAPAVGVATAAPAPVTAPPATASATIILTSVNLGALIIRCYGRRRSTAALATNMQANGGSVLRAQRSDESLVRGAVLGHTDCY
ncbi:Uncharacterised protein [Mycobacteroides abscessus subsp. abscessus]|nr:Uncharacterised protein [Mycobacteroides abscessus subsp. abscessus]